MPKTHRLSPGAIKFFREGHVGHFVTLMRDGSPQVTAVWVDVEDDGSRVLVNASVGKLKVKNATRDPRVALSVVDGRDWRRYAIVRGRVVEQRTEGAAEHYEYLKERYEGRRSGILVEGRIVLYIRPEWVMERDV
jgi:PPOX class probable F420-dependent enzyme